VPVESTPISSGIDDVQVTGALTGEPIASSAAAVSWADAPSPARNTEGSSITTRATVGPGGAFAPSPSPPHAPATPASHTSRSRVHDLVTAHPWSVA